MPGAVLTHCEALEDLLRRRGQGAYLSQKRGVITWLAMGGPNNSMVLRGRQAIGPSLFSLRPILREFAEFARQQGT